MNYVWIYSEFVYDKSRNVYKEYSHESYKTLSWAVYDYFHVPYMISCSEQNENTKVRTSIRLSRIACMGRRTGRGSTYIFQTNYFHELLYEDFHETYEKFFFNIDEDSY